jgi:transcriptional regulator with XRE-family HTH domain
MRADPKRVKPAGELSQDPRRLRRRRLMNRMKIREAAAKAGISIGFLSELENGYKSAGVDTLAALADAYGCEVEDILQPEANGAAA